METGQQFGKCHYLPVLNIDCVEEADSGDHETDKNKKPAPILCYMEMEILALHIFMDGPMKVLYM